MIWGAMLRLKSLLYLTQTGQIPRFRTAACPLFYPGRLERNFPPKPRNFANIPAAPDPFADICLSFIQFPPKPSGLDKTMLHAFTFVCCHLLLYANDLAYR